MARMGDDTRYAINRGNGKTKRVTFGGDAGQVDAQALRG
jgi:hypothetical protein